MAQSKHDVLATPCGKKPSPAQHDERSGARADDAAVPHIGGALPQEEVEDRPSVSSVKPTDYPLDQRAKG